MWFHCQDIRRAANSNPVEEIHVERIDLTLIDYSPHDIADNIFHIYLEVTHIIEGEWRVPVRSLRLQRRKVLRRRQPRHRQRNCPTIERHLLWY
jgi:hypothetical protein